VISVLSFQVLWFLVVSISAWNRFLRIPLALLSALAAFLADTLNSFVSCHYQVLHIDDDTLGESGLFFFLFWAIPMVMDLLIITISFCKELFEVLARSLRMKARIRAKRRMQQGKRLNDG
jgi:hypothetical protein